MSFINNVKTTVHASATTSATTLDVTKATAPFNDPPTAGRITLMDSLTSPTKIEIIIYTGRTDNTTYWTLTGCTRGSESTTASTWAANDNAIQAFTAGDATATDTAVALNTAKVTNVVHPLVEAAVPSNAVFTDTDTVYTHPANHAISVITGLQTALDGKLSTTGDGSGLSGIDPVVVGASLPSPVSAQGSLFYVSGTKKFYVSDGTSWGLVANRSPESTGGTVVIATASSNNGTYSYNLGLDFSDEKSTDAELVYTLESGTLPIGSSLPTTGNTALTGSVGTVASTTLFSFQVKATDESGASVTQNYQQTIESISPSVTGGTVTISGVNEGYSASYDVDTNFTFPAGATFAAFSVSSGALPTGLSLNTSSGVISGTAGNVGSNTAYNFAIRGTDTDGDTADQAYSWTVNTVAPTSTGGTVTITAVTEAGSMSYDVDANFTFGTGKVFSAYSLLSGSMPSGASINASSGVISGTAGNVSSNTAYTFTIRGTDTDGDTVDQGYSWTVNVVAPTVTGGTVSISATSEGASASYDVDTNFSYPAGTTRKSTSAYSLQSGSLPSGLSLDVSSGVISGTAGNNASFSFTIRGTDTDGVTADQAYTWVINTVAPTSTGGTVTIAAVITSSSASYDVDTNFTFGTGSAFSAFSVSSGSLPTGLSLNTSTGIISGTASSTVATYTFAIRGTDTDGDTVDQSYSWSVSAPPAGEATYTSTGASTWVCPAGVTSVCVVVVGGGSSGGNNNGSLGWKNNISVTPSSSYTAQVGAKNGVSWFSTTSTVWANGGGYNAARSYVGDGGGLGGTAVGNWSNGGPGAGGYTGNGGNAQNGTSTTVCGSGGGGVGLFGTGSNGTGWSNGAGGGGGGGGMGGGTRGTGGSSGTNGVTGTSTAPGNGGFYGGGGAGRIPSVGYNGSAGTGAVRIIWGPSRSFPSNAT